MGFNFTCSRILIYGTEKHCDTSNSNIDLCFSTNFPNNKTSNDPLFYDFRCKMFIRVQGSPGKFIVQANLYTIHSRKEEKGWTLTPIKGSFESHPD